MSNYSKVVKTLKTRIAWLEKKMWKPIDPRSAMCREVNDLRSALERVQSAKVMREFLTEKGLVREFLHWRNSLPDEKSDGTTSR